MINSLKKLAWVSYDALNSLVIIIGAVYFTKWMIADAGVSDTAVAVTTSSASVLFILIGPRFGAALRSEESTWKALLVLTILVGVFATALGLPGLSDSRPQGLLYAALVSFFLLNVLYQLSLVAYNTYLPRLVQGQAIQHYSGLGESAGQVGSVVGVLIALGLLTKPWFDGASVRLLLVVGPVVLVLCLVAVLALRSRGVPPNSEKVAGNNAVDDLVEKDVRAGFVSLLRHREFKILVVVVFLYNNAFATLQVFSSSYLAIAAGFEEREVGLGILVTLLGAALGGLLGATLKRTLKLGHLFQVGLFTFAGSITGLAFLGQKGSVFLSLLGGGVGFGLLAAVARACVVYMARDHSNGLKFGLYGAVSRSSAVVGPLLWAVSLKLWAGFGEVMSRQAGMATLAGLIWCAFLVANRSKLGRLEVHKVVSREIGN